MARARRERIQDGVYHVFSRGNEKSNIFFEVRDYLRFLEILTDVVEEFNWTCAVYCLMGNHYHLLVQTHEANISEGMQKLNSLYAQYINKKYSRVGHLFQGRYGSVLIKKVKHLMQVMRYIVFNPVKDGFVKSMGHYSWSSYKATVGEMPSPSFLDVQWVLNFFSGNRSEARRLYKIFVNELTYEKCSLPKAVDGCYVDNDLYLKAIKLTEKQKERKHRDQQIKQLYYCDGFSAIGLAEQFGLHRTTIHAILRS